MKLTLNERYKRFMAVLAVGLSRPGFLAHFRCVILGGACRPIPLGAGREAGGSASENPAKGEPCRARVV